MRVMGISAIPVEGNDTMMPESKPEAEEAAS
jgi:hypothetical protein